MDKRFSSSFLRLPSPEKELVEQSKDESKSDLKNIPIFLSSFQRNLSDSILRGEERPFRVDEHTNILRPISTPLHLSSFVCLCAPFTFFTDLLHLIDNQ